MASTTCEKCSRTFKNAAGLGSHRRHCKGVQEGSAAPRPFGPSGQAFFDRVTADFELSVTEQRTLVDVCREIDLVDRLQAALDTQPLIVHGSMGQPVASPLVQELRQHRSTLDRLLRSLALPADDDPVAGDRSTSARERAMQRWGTGGA